MQLPQYAFTVLKPQGAAKVAGDYDFKSNFTYSISDLFLSIPTYELSDPMRDLVF